MILYGSNLSPFVRKTLAYGAEKGLTFELVAAGFGEGGAGFAEASPLGKMPALRDPGADDGRDFCIADSSAIITYLEARHPAPELIPAAAIPRARTIWFEEFSDTLLVRAAVTIVLNRFVMPKRFGREGDLAAADKAEHKDLPPLYDYLNGVVPDSGFLIEDRVTLADVAIVAPFVNLMHVGLGVDAVRWPKLAAYLDGILARPSFAGLLAAERAALAKLG